jgi:ribosomal protein L12E/L44/L45/RPP1/RPP2
MTKNIIIVSMICALLCVLSAPARAAESAPAKDQAPAAKEEKAGEPEITKEEIVERLKNIYQYHADIAQSVKGLAVKEEGGKTVVTYGGKPLEEMSKEDLLVLLRSANQQISAKNIQRLDRQMKNLRQIQNIERIQRMSRQQGALPSVPKTPQTYKTTSTYKPPATYKSSSK